MDKTVYKRSVIDPDGSVIDVSVVLHDEKPYLYLEYEDAEIVFSPSIANQLCGHIAAAANHARKEQNNVCKE